MGASGMQKMTAGGCDRVTARWRCELGIADPQAVALGDTPYDAEAAGKSGIPAVGLHCGGFTEAELRRGGCIAVYPGPAALLTCFGASPLAGTGRSRRPGI